jgi:hypothetical protein
MGQRPPGNYAGKPATVPTAKKKRVKVRATRLGYYDHARRREGDVFVMDEHQVATHSWVERVPSNTPESISTSQDAINLAHDELLAAKAAPPTGEAGL